MLSSRQSECKASCGHSIGHSSGERAGDTEKLALWQPWLRLWEEDKKSRVGRFKLKREEENDRGVERKNRDNELSLKAV